jgi:DNA-directed RNA polymerase subunit RPC12/RpoP
VGKFTKRIKVRNKVLGPVFSGFVRGGRNGFYICSDCNGHAVVYNRDRIDERTLVPCPNCKAKGRESYQYRSFYGDPTRLSRAPAKPALCYPGSGICFNHAVQPRKDDSQPYVDAGEKPDNAPAAPVKK